MAVTSHGLTGWTPDNGFGFTFEVVLALRMLVNLPKRYATGSEVWAPVGLLRKLT